MTAYFVGTAVATIRSSSPWSKRVSFLATAMAVVIALALIASGIQGIASPLLTPGGVPARTIGVMSLVLATILAVAVLPEPFPSASMRALPIMIIFGAMTCWLWRVRSRAP
jgi:sorbitol-specific phosphotransferase system component IIBC